MVFNKSKSTIDTNDKALNIIKSTPVQFGKLRCILGTLYIFKVKATFGRPRPARTIADAIAQRKRLEFTCLTCKTITSKEASDLFYTPNVELAVLEQVTVCPECGASNIAGFPKQLILTAQD